MAAQPLRDRQAERECSSRDGIAVQSRRANAKPAAVNSASRSAAQYREWHQPGEGRRIDQEGVADPVKPNHEIAEPEPRSPTSPPPARRAIVRRRRRRSARSRPEVRTAPARIERRQAQRGPARPATSAMAPRFHPQARMIARPLGGGCWLRSLRTGSVAGRRRIVIGLRALGSVLLRGDAGSGGGTFLSDRNAQPV